MQDNSCKRNKIPHAVLFAFMPNLRCTGVSKHMISILFNVCTAHIDMFEEHVEAEKFMQGQTQ